MKNLLVSVIFLLVSSTVFCQDYEVDYTFNNGYTRVYKKLPATSQYQNAPEKTYGVIDAAKKLVVPMQFKSILSCSEKGLFIVKDQKDEVGLFSSLTQKYLVQPQYFEIEGFSEGLAVVKKRSPDFGFVWGAVDVTGKIAIPVEYDYLGVLKEGLMNFKKDNKMGFLDRNNKIVIPAMYYDFSTFSEGLAAVKVEDMGKYGYIDKNNKLVIAAEYEDAGPFYHGFAYVAKKKGYALGKVGQKSTTVPGEWTAIDKTGKKITENTYDKVSLANTGGLFVIEQAGKKGVMNSSGKIISPIEYTDVTVDNDGYIIYKTADKKYGLNAGDGSEIVAPKYNYLSQTSAGRYYGQLNGKYEVGDVNKKILIPADSANGVILGKKRIVYHYNNKVKIFDAKGALQKTIADINLKNYGHSLSQTEDSVKLNAAETVQLINLSANTKKSFPFGEAGDFNQEGIFVAKQSSKYDFYDFTGKKLNTESYHAVVNFSEGICALQKYSTSTPYLADKDFKKIKDLAVSFTGPYSEGLAYASNSSLGKLYYLDKTGTEAFSLYAKEAGTCTEGFILIKGNSGKLNHVNKTGKAVGNKTWEEAGNFSEGMALVKDKGKCGFIDTAGNLVIGLKYDLASGFTKGAAIVKSGNDYFLINKKGEVVNNNKYEAAGNPANGTFPVQKNEKVGLIDSKGNTLVDFKYKNMMSLAEDRTWAVKESKWALLDNKGKELTGFIYDAAYDFQNGYAQVVINNKAGMVNKTGKLVLPTQYKSIGHAYKNMVVCLMPAEEIIMSIK
ncbi:MAG: WG repeat-containing protein [Ferruginibacter sp.]